MSDCLFVKPEHFGEVEHLLNSTQAKLIEEHFAFCTSEAGVRKGIRTAAYRATVVRGLEFFYRVSVVEVYDVGVSVEIADLFLFCTARLGKLFHISFCLPFAMPPCFVSVVQYTVLSFMHLFFVHVDNCAHVHERNAIRITIDSLIHVGSD